MCTKEIRDKFLKLFEQFQAIKQLNGEKSLGFKETVIKILLALVTKLLIRIIENYWRE